MKTRYKRRITSFCKLLKTAIKVAGVCVVLSACTPNQEPKNTFKKYHSSTPEKIAKVAKKKRSVAAASEKVRSDNLIQNLVSKYWRIYLQAKEDEFESFCHQHGLNKRSFKLRKDYSTAKLLYEIVRSDGLLGNKYELIETRKMSIRRIKGDKFVPIGDDGKERYPAKMMRDMFSATPKYVTFPDKKLFSFGDCDELEMVYVNLLRNLSMKAKIVMTASNHVQTLVKIGNREYLVDNSFSIFGHERICSTKCRNWVTGTPGYKDWRKAKAYIDLVNKRARANAKVIVTEKAATRITNAILSDLK